MATKKQIEAAAIAHYDFDPACTWGEPIPWAELNEHVRMRHRKQAKITVEAAEAIPDDNVI